MLSTNTRAEVQKRHMEDFVNMTGTFRVTLLIIVTVTFLRDHASYRDRDILRDQYNESRNFLFVKQGSDIRALRNWHF